MTATPRVPAPENIDIVTNDFDAFFRAHYARLFSALCLITRDRHEAEELAQAAFLVVLERWDRVRRYDSPDGYLYRVAMNGFRKRIRRSKRALRVVDQTDTSTDGGISAIDANDVAMRALEPLTRAERAAVILIDLLELPSDEAARYLGTTPGAVRTAASRGRAELRRLQGGTSS